MEDGKMVIALCELLLVIGAVGSFMIIIFDAVNGRWTLITSLISVFLFFIILTAILISGGEEEYGLRNVLEHEYDDIVERLAENPFDKDTILEAIEMNYRIDRCNTRGKGDYCGMEPIDYEEMQKEYLFDTYEDEILEKYGENKDEREVEQDDYDDIDRYRHHRGRDRDHGDIVIDGDLVTYAIGKFFEGFDS